MDIIDSAMDTLKSGVSAARGAVSGVAVEQLGFVRGFRRLCDDGWQQGWHERNGGNLTYRMKEEEVEQARPFFNATPGEWVNMGVQADSLRGAFFLTTGSGRYMRNVMSDPSHNIGIVEINDVDGMSMVNHAAFVVGGLHAHGMVHEMRGEFGSGLATVGQAPYDAPGIAGVIAMTFVCPLDARYFTRALWKAMTECIVVFPSGVGVVPWMVPGGAEIAKATSELMKKYEAAVWAQHGLFVSGPDFDTTFGLMHTIEKAADVYRRARQMNGGSDEFLNTISDEGQRQIGIDFGLTVNDEFLD